MATSVTVTGSGSVGDVSSWSFTEGVASPVPSEPVPNLGTANVTAVANDESKFSINNDIIIDSDEIGSINGTVSNVGIQGPAATLSMTTELKRFNADFTIPPVTGGTMAAATDLLMQLSGSKFCTLDYDSGRYWSLRGHSAGFDVRGELVQYADNTSYFASEYFIPGPGTFEPYVAGAINMDGGLFAQGGFTLDARGYHAQQVYGNGIEMGVGKHPTIALKFRPDVSAKITIAGGPDDSNISTGFKLDCGWNQSTNVLEITGYAQVGGIDTNISESTSAATISGVGEMQMVLYPRFVASGGLDISLYLVNTSDYATSVSLVRNIGTAVPDYFTPWLSMGRIRAVYQADEGSDISSVLIGADYEVSDYGYTASSAAQSNELNDSIIVGSRINGWEYLNQVATARGCEIALDGATVVVRGRGELADVEIPTDQVGDLQISSIAAGLSVDVNYTGAEKFTTNGYPPSDPMPSFGSSIYPMNCVNLYDSFNDGRSWSVNAGEVTTVQIPLTEANAAFVANPKPSIYWNDPDEFLAQKGVTEFGTYVVSGSDNLPIPPEEWLEFGGNVTVRLTDDPGIVEMTMTAPLEIPGVDGPFTFSVSDGATNYPSLTIAGRGIAVDADILNMPTGASGTTVAVATTINNVAIDKVSIARDVGNWAAARAAGTWQSVSISVPTVNLQAWSSDGPGGPYTNLGAFGYSAGSVFRLGDARLRVDSVTIGKVSSTINATYYTTLGDFDGVWSGGDVAEFDALWSGFDFADAKVSPLRR